LIYNPYDKLYLSAGMSNLYSVDTKDMVYQASATYSLLDWLTMHGRLQYCAESPIFWGEKYSSEFGIVAAINKKRIISSFSVNPVAREARFGLEVAFDVFSIGVLSEGSTLNTPGGRFNGGNILLRVNHDSIFANEHYRNAVTSCNTQECNINGCQGVRCMDAICPAYRCIKMDCPGKACTRSVCTGLNCTHGHSGKTILIEEQHTHTKTILCSHCAHPFKHDTQGYANHNSGGCSQCGCAMKSHGVIEGSHGWNILINQEESHMIHHDTIYGSSKGMNSVSGSAATPNAGKGSASGSGTGSGDGKGAGSGDGKGAGSGDGKGAGQKSDANKDSGKDANAEKGKKPAKSNDDSSENKNDIDDPWIESPEDPESDAQSDEVQGDDFPGEEPNEDPEQELGSENPFEPAPDPISELMNQNQGSQNEQGKPSGPKKGKNDIGQTFKLRRVFFDHDKWDIKPESIEELDKLQSYLTKNPNLCVRLDAHTDSNGSNEYNKELSRKRAQSVVDYLISKGTDPIRLSAEGFGEEMPVTTNETSEGREENRRVEFTKIGC
jgi:outer membrane protein OmpA-like peptidoglycan-associated protein